MSEEKLTMDQFKQSTVPVFGYSLLREVLLPSILGKETGAILYWAGKELARKYPQHSIEETMKFFENAGWGRLSIAKEAKNELRMELTDLPNWNEATEESLQLEAGFLAQQVASIKEASAEAFLHQKKRALKCIFTVKW